MDHTHDGSPQTSYRTNEAVYLECACRELALAAEDETLNIAPFVITTAFRVSRVYGIPVEDTLTPRYKADIMYDLASFSEATCDNQQAEHTIQSVGKITGYYAAAAAVAEDDIARRQTMHIASVGALHALQQYPPRSGTPVRDLQARLERYVDAARVGAQMLRKPRSSNVHFSSLDSSDRAEWDIASTPDPALTEQIVLANERYAEIRSLPESAEDSLGNMINVRYIIAALASGYRPQELIKHGVASEPQIDFAVSYFAAVADIDHSEYVSHLERGETRTRLTKSPLLHSLHTLARRIGNLERIFGVIEHAGLTSHEAAVLCKEFGYFMPQEHMLEFYINQDIAQQPYLVYLRSAIQKLDATYAHTPGWLPARPARAIVHELTNGVTKQSIAIPSNLDDVVGLIARIRSEDPARYDHMPLKPRHRAVVEHALGQLAANGHINLEELEATYAFRHQNSVRSVLSRTLGKLASTKQFLSATGRRFNTGSVIASIMDTPKEQALAALAHDQRLQRYYTRLMEQTATGIIKPLPTNKRFLFEIFYALNPDLLDERLHRLAEKHNMTVDELHARLLAAPASHAHLAQPAKALGMTPNELYVLSLLVRNEQRRQEHR